MLFLYESMWYLSWHRRHPASNASHLCLGGIYKHWKQKSRPHLKPSCPQRRMVPPGVLTGDPTGLKASAVRRLCPWRRGDEKDVDESRGAFPSAFLMRFTVAALRNDRRPTRTAGLCACRRWTPRGVKSPGPSDSSSSSADSSDTSETMLLWWLSGTMSGAGPFRCGVLGTGA